MRIVLAGGGTGGHFYPLIAVAQALREVAIERKLLSVDIYYIAPDPYNSRALFENDITFKKIYAGKLRRYPSIKNLFDIFKTTLGIIKACWLVFSIYPDIVFSKGGYASFPVLVAARILGIPVVIHESDSEPGRVNAWAGKFADRVAISYSAAAEFFPKEKVAQTGNPIRKELLNPTSHGAYEFLKLEEGVPTIFILGGSQGSVRINDTILDTLPTLVEKYQIIHQTGKANIEEIRRTAAVILEKSQHPERYRPFDYLSGLAMRMAAGVSSLIISRGGSQIFEIASWKIPSIIIPIPPPTSHDQLKNAFAYARCGAAIVIEENNLTPGILISEIEKILGSKELQDKMKMAATSFSKTDAARKIAEVIIEIALPHEA